MTSAMNAAFVIEVMDLPACKNLAIARKYDHPDQVFGCAWNPFNAREFITACQDGLVRLFDNSGDGKPLKTFEGHVAKIYAIVFSPVLKNIFATAGDDRAIRIWQSDGAPTATAICGGENIKNSHTQNVRALAFIPDIPFALLSGSWDAMIKMWDIRNGNHLWTITDHCSDVYGITLHPSRPFVFSSCSRDTSIRTFTIDGFI